MRPCFPGNIPSQARVIGNLNRALIRNETTLLVERECRRVVRRTGMDTNPLRLIFPLDGKGISQQGMTCAFADHLGGNPKERQLDVRPVAAIKFKEALVLPSLRQREYIYWGIMENHPQLLLRHTQSAEPQPRFPNLTIQPPVPAQIGPLNRPDRILRHCGSHQVCWQPPHLEIRHHVRKFAGRQVSVSVEHALESSKLLAARVRSGRHNPLRVRELEDRKK